MVWVCPGDIECLTPPLCKAEGVCRVPPPGTGERWAKKARATAKIAQALRDIGPGATPQQIAARTGLSLQTLKREARFAARRAARQRQELLFDPDDEDDEDDDEGETEGR